MKTSSWNGDHTTGQLYRPGPDFAQWQISSFWIQTWPQQQMLRCAMRKAYIIMYIYIHTLIFILWFYVYCLGISCLALSIESYVYAVYASLRSIIFWTILTLPICGSYVKPRLIGLKGRPWQFPQVAVSISSYWWKRRAGMFWEQVLLAVPSNSIAIVNGLEWLVIYIGFNGIWWDVYSIIMDQFKGNLEEPRKFTHLMQIPFEPVLGDERDHF